jgi:hypothetical protein
MISSEVQRTLVKSPPELWTELSDPANLGRHLGELGEIRITRIDPEQKVEWEAENTSGTVLIKPSGWGTKVTLTVTRNIPEPEPAVASEPPPEPPAPQAETEPDFSVEDEPVPAEIEDEPVAAEIEDEPVFEVEPDPALATSLEEATEPERPLARLRGRFARLLARRHSRETVESDQHEAIATEEPVLDAFVAGAAMEPVSELPDGTETTQPEVEPLMVEPPVDPAEPLVVPVKPPIDPVVPAVEPPEPIAMVEPVSDAVQSSEPAESQVEETADVSSVLKAAEEVAAEQVTAVLTSVLDRLGAAHHRPFSRS